MPQDRELSGTNRRREGLLMTATPELLYLLSGDPAEFSQIVAGMRQLNTNAESDRARYTELMDEADVLRREAITLPILSPEERRELEAIGETQSRIEVGLAVARAYAATGQAANFRWPVRLVVVKHCVGTVAAYPLGAGRTRRRDHPPAHRRRDGHDHATGDAARAVDENRLTALQGCRP